jgi:hypothetical protein
MLTTVTKFKVLAAPAGHYFPYTYPVYLGTFATKQAAREQAAFMLGFYRAVKIVPIFIDTKGGPA